MICLCEYLTRAGCARPGYARLSDRRSLADGVRILECRSLDTLAVLPDEINGLPVTELAPYLFSVHGNCEDDAAAETFWWPEPPATPADQNIWRDIPALRGGRLEELRLPAYLEKVGAYALYNCEKLKKLELYSTTLDWGAGVFTGCYGVEQVTFHVDESRKSCMREVLAELRQTLEVLYLPEQVSREDLRQRYDLTGLQQSHVRLIFPEFFEEAVENTPARILVTETHGCGQKYRNAFVNTQFQFKEYDSLFPHVQVQEPEALTARLALGRLMEPYRLEEPYAERYREYLKEHAAAAAGWAVENGDMQALEWIFTHVSCDGEMIAGLLDIAGACQNGAAVSFLMDRRRAAGAVARKRFSL